MAAPQTVPQPTARPRPDRRTMLARINRLTQAGYPAPDSIRFRDDLNSIFLGFGSRKEIDNWVSTLGGWWPSQPKDGLCTAYADWAGWKVDFMATEPTGVDPVEARADELADLLGLAPEPGDDDYLAALHAIPVTVVQIGGGK